MAPYHSRSYSNTLALNLWNALFISPYLRVEHSQTYIYARSLANNENLLRPKTDRKSMPTTSTHIMAFHQMCDDPYEQAPYHHYDCCYWKCIWGMQTSVTNGIRICLHMSSSEYSCIVRSTCLIWNPHVKPENRPVDTYAKRLFASMTACFSFSFHELELPNIFQWILSFQSIVIVSSANNKLRIKAASICTCKHEWASENFLHSQLTPNKLWTGVNLKKCQKCSTSKLDRNFESFNCTNISVRAL